MGILTRLKAREDSTTVVGPAAQALTANIARAEELQREIERLTALDTDVLAARGNAQARVNAPITFRTQLAAAEVAAMAEAELSGATVDGTVVQDLRIQLEESERLAGPAATRVAVEDAKHTRLQAQLDALRAAQRQSQAEHAALGAEALWEALSDKAAALTAARWEFLTAFDAAFATARAIDKLAEAQKTGRFANSGAAADLRLPVVAGMAELPYSAQEHWQRLETAAVGLLREIGLHA